MTLYSIMVLSLLLIVACGEAANRQRRGYPDADVDAGEAVNTATATGTPPAGPDVTDTSTVTVPVTSIAWIVTKTSVVTQVTGDLTNVASVSATNSLATGGASVTDTVVVATDITYTITITNIGDGNALGVKIKDILPAGVTITSISAGGSASGNTVTYRSLAL